MPLFSYRAVDKNNQIKESTTSANSRQEVAAELSKQGLTPLSISQIQNKKEKGSLPAIEKITLCRYVSTMLRSGLSITETISVLSSESTHPLTKKILNDLEFGIQHGQSISTLFAKYPQSFNSFFVTLVQAGEVSGTLGDTFAQIEQEIRAEHNLSEKIQGALLYPAVVFIAMIGIGVLMFFFILPQIGNVFLNLNLPLATPTRLMFEITLALSGYKYYILGGLTLTAAAIVAYVRTSSGKKAMLTIITPVPVVKNLIVQIDLARFCRVFSTLLRSGVPITQALEIGLNSLSYPKYTRNSSVIIEMVTKGQPLAAAFKSTKLFPPLLTQMIASGEKSGTLDETLKDLGVFYEEEVENSVKKTTQILEPILMLLVGIGVGIMVLAVITPIYSVVSNLQASSP